MILGLSEAEIEQRLSEEQGKIRKLQILFGPWWRHYALPCELKWTLYSERDACPYCATPLQISVGLGIQDHESNDRHIDHMDPLSRGGEESFRNALCVCAKCNMAKGKRLFVDWLAKIPEPNRSDARAIYIQKLGRPPEVFCPGPRQVRILRTSIELGLEESVLRKLFPKPVVKGPPKH